MIRLAIAVMLAAPAAAAPFELTSTSFADGAVLAPKHAGNLPTNPNCTGTNVSPQLGWSNVPAGTASLAFVMHDPEGRNGTGVTHWVAYGVPPTRAGFAEGEVAKAPAGYVGGTSTQGLDHYMGPCTPRATAYHHYTWTIIATDLPPDALPAGLTREELFAKLAGHAKASAGLVGRFRQ